MADNSLEILFKTVADLQPAQDLQAALEIQIKLAKATGKEYDHLGRQHQELTDFIAATEAGMKGESEASQKNALETFALSNKKLELKKHIGALTQAFPALGWAAQAALNPISAAIGIAIAALLMASAPLRPEEAQWL